MQFVGMPPRAMRPVLRCVAKGHWARSTGRWLPLGVCGDAPAGNAFSAAQVMDRPLGPLDWSLASARRMCQIAVYLSVTTSYVISSETKWSREIYALSMPFRSNRCVDPSTSLRFAQDDKDGTLPDKLQLVKYAERMLAISRAQPNGVSFTAHAGDALPVGASPQTAIYCTVRRSSA